MQNSNKKVVVRNKRRIDVKVVRSPKIEKAAPKDSAEKIPFKLSESEKKIIQAYRMAGRDDKAAVQNTLVHYFLPSVTKPNDEKPALPENVAAIPSEPHLFVSSRGTLRKILAGVGICCVALFATFLFIEFFFTPMETEPAISDVTASPSPSYTTYNDDSKKISATKSGASHKLTLDDICSILNNRFSKDDGKEVSCSTDGKAVYIHFWVDNTYQSLLWYQETFPDSMEDCDLWKQVKSTASQLYSSVKEAVGEADQTNADIFIDILNDTNPEMSLYSVENGIVTYDFFTDDDIAKLSISDASTKDIKRSTENLSGLSYSVRSDWYFDNRPIDTSPSGVKGLGSIQTNYYQISSDEPSHIRATAAKSYYYSGDSVDEVVNRLIDMWESEDNGISSATYEISAKESLKIDNNTAIKVIYQNDYNFGGSYEHTSYFVLIDDTLYTFDLTLVPDIKYSVKREYETEFAAIIDSIQCPI